MTDSGSFDSGDVMYGSDQQALYDLIAAKCAAAGVAGPTENRANYGAGSLATGVRARSLVYAYQRAWDASTNKPGTRQAAPADASLIYGALYQNMWTQLNSMTFDAWISWDESSEAGLASANDFVAFCENTSAGGNEAGQGGGFSGADLVFTQSGTVPGATGTPLTRTISGGGGMRLDWTQAALEAVLKNTAQWSLLWKIYGKPMPNGHQAVELWDGGSNYVMFASFNSNTTLDVYLQMAGTTKWNWASVGSDALPSSGAIYFGLWKDATYIRAGWSTSRFTKWSDLGANKRVSLSDTTQFSAMGSSRRAVFGTPGAVSPTVSCRWFVASKRCLIDNNA